MVVGRNGSGKSSFAEALEVLLTGQLRRWEKLSAVWRQGWRSMHHPQQAQITAEFLVEGAGPAVVQRTWPDGADFATSSVYVQFRGEKRAGLEQLGWSAALADHRPFLAHSEIEAFFGSPSGLYELLASVLGLEDLNAAATRLRQARLSRESAFKEVSKSLRDLLIRLEGTADERAGVCLAALSGRTPDLAAARQAASGVRAADGGSELGRLRRLAQLTVPAEDEVRDATTMLREAAAGLEAVAGSSAGRARALAALLTAALQHHEAHGDGDCPVCGRAGALTAEWRQATEQEVARLGQEAQDAEDAERAAAEARRHALTLVQPSPPVLSEAAPWGVDPGPALAAWAKWAAVPDPGAPLTAAGLRALADHLEQALPSLAGELQSLSADADAKYAEREDAWAPVAAAVLSWCASAEQAQAGLAPVASIKAAEAWLKAATDEIRNERLAPLATQAKSIWAMLRQESNVDLGAIRLVGSSTQRHVELDVSVDGAPGSALGVMSQGEVNALALAVFLPRARLPASPFRFLVIDDPVQAMDPAKVDGLARVLEKAAADRQVIVFTHDNRLAEAVRQLRLPATVLEVTRRPGSVVEVRECLDPVQQALRDAGALAADRSVPSEISARVVPGFCRTALEAALTEVIWRRQLRDGRGHAEIEDLAGGGEGTPHPAGRPRADRRRWPGQRSAAAAEFLGPIVRRHLPGAQSWRARCSYGRSRPADPRHPSARGQDPCEPAVAPEELLAAAGRLVEHPDAGTAGVWPRAAALLARQAIEQAMAGLWAGRPGAAGLSDGTMRSQLLCLTAYVDEDVATRAAYLSAALSRVCHYHPYELAPTASELTGGSTKPPTS